MKSIFVIEIQIERRKLHLRAWAFGSEPQRYSFAGLDAGVMSDLLPAAEMGMVEGVESATVSDPGRRFPVQ